MSLKTLEINELLLRKVVSVAQFESEVDLGVNPKCLNQANTGYLTEQDFDYINRVCVLVDKRLKDSNWLTKTIDSIVNKSAINREIITGIRFDNELFKGGRGVLESYINESCLECYRVEY